MASSAIKVASGFDRLGSWREKLLGSLGLVKSYILLGINLFSEARDPANREGEELKDGIFYQILMKAGLGFLSQLVAFLLWLTPPTWFTIFGDKNLALKQLSGFLESGSFLAHLIKLIKNGKSQDLSAGFLAETLSNIAGSTFHFLWKMITSGKKLTAENIKSLADSVFQLIIVILNYTLAKAEDTVMVPTKVVVKEGKKKVEDVVENVTEKVTGQ